MELSTNAVMKPIIGSTYVSGSTCDDRIDHAQGAPSRPLGP